MLKTQYFTIGDGPVFGFMAAELANRLRIWNGITVRHLRDGVAGAYNVHGCYYWLKAFLWDFVSDETERIIYFDADMLPVSPMPNYILECSAPFSARLDITRTSISQRSQHKRFSNIKNYFNNGFFVATRDSVPMFNAFREEVDNPIKASCIEQTWMNVHVDESVHGLNVLSAECAHMVESEGEKHPRGTFLRHYAGLKDKLTPFLADMEKYK